MTGRWIAIVLSLVGCASQAPAPKIPRSRIQVLADTDPAASSETKISPESPEQELSEADEREMTIASLLSQRGRHAEAIKLLSALHRRNPIHAGVLEDLVWECIPLPSCRANLPRLQRDLKAHVVRFPNDLGRRLTFIDLLEVTGEKRERHEQIYALIRDYPTTSEGWVLGAELALADNDLETASKLVSRATKLQLHAEENRERLDAIAKDVASAVREGERAARDRERDARTRPRRLERSLSRGAFHLRLDDGDDF